MSIEFLNSLIMALTIVVGILSVLVMVLIGLQVNQFAKFKMWKKKMKKQMDEIYTKGTKEIDENNIIALLGVHEISRNMAIGMKLQNMMFKYIQSALFAIMYYVKLNDFDRCNIVVRQLIDDIQIENIMLSEPDKGKIIDLLQVTPSREKIKSFDILYRLLIMLPAYSPSPQEPQ